MYPRYSVGFDYFCNFAFDTDFYPATAVFVVGKAFIVITI